MVLVVFSLGYIKGARGNIRCIRKEKGFNEGEWSVYLLVRNLIKVVIILSACFVMYQWYQVFITGGGIDISKLGESYVKYYEGYERGQARVDLLYVLNILAQAVLTLALFFGVFYYKKLSRKMGWLFVFVVVSYILINVLVSGKQKFFGDVVIILFFYFLINVSRSQRRVSYKFIGVGAICVTAVIGVFVELLNQRYIAAGIGLNNIGDKVHPLMVWDQESYLFDILGDEYGFAFGVFLWYFTNGIYGLSLSLSLPFEWTYFVGNSYSLGRIVEIISGGDVTIIDKTYPARVGFEYGWDLSKWHSLFSWLASDFTFLGVIIIAFFFGVLYGGLWVSAIRLDNPYSGPLFLCLSLGLIFSYSNNQLMHSMAGVIALITLIVLYTYFNFTKRKYCN